MSKHEFDFKIGADPEFVLTMQGKKVDAKQTMELMLKNKKEFKTGSQGFKIEGKGEIGWDGASSTGEIRPEAENSIEKMVENINILLKGMTKYINLCDLSTISEFSAIGGHIHFEIPKGENWSTQKRTSIHKRLASFYIPMLLAENKTNLNLRIRQNYGSIKDYRIEDKFTREDGTRGQTLEFRTPSAEWLTTPKIAQATLVYLAVVYHEILKHPRKFTKYNEIIYKSDKQGDALQTLAIMEFDLLTKQILNKTKKYIKEFELYKKYEKEIEYILNPQKVIHDKQKANYNIMIGWNLSEKSKKPSKKDILSNKKNIQEIAKKTDFDVLKKIINIHYNDDTKVSIFAEALKDRVAAFNWKLKNTYYIFGIRKGINELIAKDFNQNFLTKTKVIKTQTDFIAINDILKRMESRFNQISHRQPIMIDFKTGKPKNINENRIIIGVPYEMRIEEKTKEFLQLIWEIENEKERKNEIDIKKLKDDIEKPNEKKGEIWKKIMIKSEDIEKIIIDETSNSKEQHERAIRAEVEDYQNNQPEEERQRCSECGEQIEYCCCNTSGTGNY